MKGFSGSGQVVSWNSSNFGQTLPSVLVCFVDDHRIASDESAGGIIEAAADKFLGSVNYALRSAHEVWWTVWSRVSSTPGGDWPCVPAIMLALLVRLVVVTSFSTARLALGLPVRLSTCLLLERAHLFSDYTAEIIPLGRNFFRGAGGFLYRAVWLDVRWCSFKADVGFHRFILCPPSPRCGCLSVRRGNRFSHALVEGSSLVCSWACCSSTCLSSARL